MEVFYRMDMPNTLAQSKGEIVSHKSRQKQAVIENFMLGDFDEQGKYHISQEILAELISMKKYNVDKFGSQYLIQSQLIFEKPLFFSLKVEGYKSTFSILEKIQFGSNVKKNSPYCNINSYIIEEMDIENDGEIVVDMLFKRYNILTEEVLTYDLKKAKKNEIESVFYIGTRKAMLAGKLKDMNKMTEAEVIEQEYFEASMKILKKSGEFGSVVIRDYEENIKNIDSFIEKEKNNYYKSLNQILEASVSKNKQDKYKKDIEKFDKKIEPIQKIFAEKIKEIIPENLTPIEKSDKNVKDFVKNVAPDVAKQAEKEEKDLQSEKSDDVAVVETDGAKKSNIIGKKVTNDADVSKTNAVGNATKNIKVAPVKKPAVKKDAKTSVTKTNKSAGKVFAKSPTSGNEKTNEKSSSSKSIIKSGAGKQNNAEKGVGEIYEVLPDITADNSGKFFSKKTNDNKGLGVSIGGVLDVLNETPEVSIGGVLDVLNETPEVSIGGVLDAFNKDSKVSIDNNNNNNNNKISNDYFSSAEIENVTEDLLEKK